MADEEGLVQNSKAKMAIKDGDEALSSWISCMMYKPVYQNLIHLPVGKTRPPASNNLFENNKICCAFCFPYVSLDSQDNLKTASVGYCNLMETLDIAYSLISNVLHSKQICCAKELS